MDIHRCRFVAYPLSPINAVAFSYPTVTKSQKSAPVRLAIGRANGDIEIWNPQNGMWHHESTLYGGKDRSIDGLVWVNEPDTVLEDGTKIVGRSRLFSIGYTNTITEWDLERGQPKQQASGMHGGIWCLAAQPARTAKDASRGAVPSGKLVAGTMDGSLVLYSIDGGDLQFDRFLVRSSSKKTKMVSMVFQNHNVVVVGCSDSAIRVYDVRNGNVLRKMTLGSDLAGGAKEIIVWSVKCIKGRGSVSDIVSGDSTGQVCIWDGKTYTQAQRLQTHKQDVLSLATSADGSTIVSGGMDRRTVFYSKTSGSATRWSKMWHRRYHRHDVKTMASFEGPGMSVVVSGGPDASPVVLPLRAAGDENHRTLSYLPQTPPVQSAPKSRLVVSWWGQEVHVWRLKKPLRELVDASDGESGIEKNRKLLATILIKGEANITSASIDPTGSLLVVSTTSDVKSFHLMSPSDPQFRSKGELQVSTVRPEGAGEQPPMRDVSKVQISPDGRWLCAIQGARDVVVVPVMLSDTRPMLSYREAVRLPRIKRKVAPHSALGGLGQYDRTITQIAFSPDSKMLAVADLAGYVDTWVYDLPRPKRQNGATGTDEESDSSSGSEDEDGEEEQDAAQGRRWMVNPKGSLIPRLQASPTVLSFSNHVPNPEPSNASDDEVVDDYTLLTVTAKPQILLIHPTLGSLTPWTRRNLIARFPVEFRNLRDLVKGALWSGERVWLYGNTFLFMFDLSQDLPESARPDDASKGKLTKQGTKRKRGPDSGAGSKMEIGAAGPTKVFRRVTGEVGKRVPLDVPEPADEEQDSDDSEDDDMETDEEVQGELALLRRAQDKGPPDPPPSQGLAFWHTYKYRPIVGIVPLGGGSDEAEETTNGNADGAVAHEHEKAKEVLEVALVERPLWEVDLPDRFVDAE